MRSVAEDAADGGTRSAATASRAAVWARDGSLCLARWMRTTTSPHWRRGLDQGLGRLDQGGSRRDRGTMGRAVTLVALLRLAPGSDDERDRLVESGGEREVRGSVNGSRADPTGCQTIAPPFPGLRRTSHGKWTESKIGRAHV